MRLRLLTSRIEVGSTLHAATHVVGHGPEVVVVLSEISGGVEGTHAKTGVAQLLTFDAVRLERFFEWWPAGSPPSSYGNWRVNELFVGGGTRRPPRRREALGSRSFK